MALSKFTVRDTVLITKAQDEYEFEKGKIVQSLTTEQGDFVHLVMPQTRHGAPVSCMVHPIMYEEKDLAHG